MEELAFVFGLSLLIIGVWLFLCLGFVLALKLVKAVFQFIKRGVRRWIIA